MLASLEPYLVVVGFAESTLALMLQEVKKNGWMIWWMLAWET